MKQFDFGVQVLLILGSAICAVCGIAEGNAVGALLGCQVFVGIWQMLSALIGLIVDLPFRKQRGWYVSLACIYLLILHFGTSHVHPPGLQITLLTVPAWTFAFYSCYLSYCTAFYSAKRNGSFLPHSSF